jgi:hypothetical protein
MRLYDQGDYAGALRAYKRGLELDPRNESLMYEVTLTLYAQGEFEQARQRAVEGVARASDVRPRYYVVLGNSLDSLGRNAEAIAALEQGLTFTPEQAELLYNLAVALSVKGDLRAARSHVKHDLELRPDHLGAHLLLARNYAASRLRVPAILAGLRFLALEGDTVRADGMAHDLDLLLDQGVTEGEKGVAIVLDVDAPKDEGNLSAVELALSMSHALQLTGKRSAREARTIQLEALMELAALGKGSADDFLQRHYVAFLAEVKRRELLTTLVAGAWPDGDAPSAAQRRALAEWARSFVPAPGKRP